MVQINFARREVNCKIVYYGPGLSGKTTNLEVVHKKVPKERCGKLTSIATEGDRTLFFDFMPISLGTVAGMDTKFQLYTVPGQTFYESTRRLVLQGADGVVFVADSQKTKADENVESFENLRRNLKENGLNIDEMPLVLQYNKRDLPDTMEIETLNKTINTNGWPCFEAVAVKGDGVMQTLKAVSEMVLENLNSRHQKTRRATKSSVEAVKPETAAPAAAKEEAEAELVAAASRVAHSTEEHARAITARRTAEARHVPATPPANAGAGYAARTRAAAPNGPPPRPKTRGCVVGGDERFRAANATTKKNNTVWYALAAIGSAAAILGLILLLT